MNIGFLHVAVWLLFSSGAVVAQQFGPNILDFNPKVGTAGDTVTFTGSGFTSGRLTVRFWNGTGCGSGVIASIRTNSDSQLTATVPAGISTGPISIQQDSLPATCTAADFLAIGPGPYISDVQPAYGDTNLNSSITIFGVHFVGVLPNGVQFNGKNSIDALPSADGTLIHVHIPNGTPAGSAPLKVTTSIGTSNSPAPFTVVGPGPFIIDFSPIMGGDLQHVQVDGIHFSGATNATFNGTRASTMSIQSDTRIDLWAPTGVTTGPIAVYGPLGVYTTRSNFFVAPTVAGVSPPSGRAGTNVTITGTNFRGTTNVTFGSVPCPAFTVVNPTTIQATVPPGAVTGLIRITTPAFSGFSTNNFVVQPTIFGFSPGLGTSGTAVTVSGANFTASGLTVRFNGLAAQSVSGVTFGQLTATVPAGATTGRISVSTADGSHTNATLFYLPASIGNFSPNTGPPGTRITITGQNFVGATVVSFNGAPAAFTVTNNSTIGATVPAGVTTGPIAVTVPGNTATSASLFYGPPLVSGFAPGLGLPGTNVVISGTNFLGATAVRFTGATAVLGSVDNGTIVTTVPSGARTGPITVEAPGGTNTSGSSFVLDYTSDLGVWVTNWPNPIFVSSNLTYAVTVINNGPFAAANVMLTNILPSSVDLTSVTLSQGSISTNGNVLVCNLGKVDPTGSGTLFLQVTPRSAGSIADLASVGSDYRDPSPANNSSGSIVTVLPLPLLSIQILTNNLLKISWPVALTNFALQEISTVAANPYWSNINTVSSISGGQRSVLQTNTSAGKFYRLKK